MFGPYDLISSMEPLMPDRENHGLEDLALSLVEKAGALSARLHPFVAREVSDLVRSMNCYYSNLIEGHNTHPRDIDRALQDRYSKQPEKRALQLEARAHIDVQRKIDRDEVTVPIPSIKFVTWIHEEFCKRLPAELLWAENPDSGEKIEVVPGKVRTSFVQVGQHIPPRAEVLSEFLKRFEDAYMLKRFTRVEQVVAVAASHHRLLWIHPFYDGNGRVARLFSHALFKQIQLGCNGLWSISRGLARNVKEYRSTLMEADHPRLNDLDGRGNLSANGLKKFCEFFLRTCLDQIDFMNGLLEPMELKKRIDFYAREQIAAKRLPKGSETVLSHVLLFGEMARGRVSSITGYKERQGRTVLNLLLKQKLLASETPKGPVRLGFPIDIVERWFPKLYPAGAEF